MKRGEFAVTVPAPLVAQMEKLRDNRKAIELEAATLKSAEYAIRDQIKKMMGRHSKAAVGRTGRYVELVTVNMPEKVLEAYSYVLLKVKDLVRVG